MTDPRDVFLNPATPAMRRYEALRARFVERCSTTEAARRFGYAPGTLRNLCSDFLANPHWSFFAPEPAPPSPSPPALDKAARDRRILQLRDQRQLSIDHIARLLDADGIPVSLSTVANVLRRHGRPRLPRRPAHLLADLARPDTAEIADARQLDLAPRRVRTSFGGLFLFLPLLERIGLDRLLTQHALPGSALIPAACAFRSLLALKLWGIGRPAQAMAEVFDPGLALFAGLNAFPKRATLTEYSCRVDHRSLPELMRTWAAAAHQAGLPRGDSFHLDFHTIPYHGDDALIEKHYVAKRSRRQKGILAFLARDDEARLFCYANATLRKADHSDEILRFAEEWRRRTGAWPGELIFDSKLTTYANLARLHELGIHFITLRRRGPQLLAAIAAAPPSDWQRITLHNVGRAYRHPRVLDQQVSLKGYPGSIRQLAVSELGHDKPTLLLTNQTHETPTRLVDRYARRMLIENAIAQAIDLFHMDALSAAVPLKIDVDLQLTVMAATLYRLLADQIGQGHQQQASRTLFRKFIHASADLVIDERTISVQFGRRANNPFLVKQGFAEQQCPIPWLGNRALRFTFGENGSQNVTSKNAVGN